MDTVKIIMLALALAFLAESMVEYILGTLFQKFTKISGWSWVLMYVSLGVGIGLAFWYQLDMLAIVTEGPSTTVGIILSGSVIGRGANFLHDFVSKYIVKKPDLW
jgi:hypothetical protein